MPSRKPTNPREGNRPQRTVTLDLHTLDKESLKALVNLRLGDRELEQVRLYDIDKEIESLEAQIKDLEAEREQLEE